MMNVVEISLELVTLIQLEWSLMLVDPNHNVINKKVVIVRVKIMILFSWLII